MSVVDRCDISPDATRPCMLGSCRIGDESLVPPSLRSSRALSSPRISCMHRILSNVLLKDYKIGAGRAGGAGGRRDRPASTAARRVAASGSCVRVCVGIKSN